jgi:hypothetical protein
MLNPGECLLWLGEVKGEVRATFRSSRKEAEIKQRANSISLLDCPMWPRHRKNGLHTKLAVHRSDFSRFHGVGKTFIRMSAISIEKKPLREQGYFLISNWLQLLKSTLLVARSSFVRIIPCHGDLLGHTPNSYRRSITLSTDYRDAYCWLFGRLQGCYDRYELMIQRKIAGTYEREPPRGAPQFAFARRLAEEHPRVIPTVSQMA